MLGSVFIHGILTDCMEASSGINWCVSHLNPQQAVSCKWPSVWPGTLQAPSSGHHSHPQLLNDTSLLTPRGITNKSDLSPSNSASRQFVTHKIDRAWGDLCSHCLCATSSVNIKLNLRFLAFRFTRHLPWQLRKTSLKGYLTVCNHAIRNFWENQSKAVALQNCQTDIVTYMPPKYLMVLVVWIWSGSNFWH